MAATREHTDSPKGADDKTARAVVWASGALAAVLCAVAVFGALHGWPGALVRMKAAGKFNMDAYVQWGEFWACAVNAVLCAGLAVLMRKAECRGQGVERGMRNTELSTLNTEGEIPNSTFRIPHSEFSTLNSELRTLNSTRATWICLCVTLSVAGALRWSRMDLSFYNDEAHTFRTYIAGHHKEADENGVQKWRQVPWKETFFMNKYGNNLTPFSVLGRVCYDAWKKITHAKEGAVCEAAVRMPALLAGLGSLLVLWLLVRRIMDGAISWCILLLGAVHPWHLRYSTEARGYGLLLLGVALCFYFTQRALENGRWRWWLGLGASQFLCVWSFPGALYWLATFNTMLIFGLAGCAWMGKISSRLFVRALVGLVFGGMLTLQLMLPTAAQLAEIAEKLDSLKGTMELTWWKDAFAGVVLGMRWMDGDPQNAWNIAGSRLVDFQPWLLGTLFIIALAVLFGLGRWFRRGLVGMLIAASGPLAMLLSWSLMLRQGKFLHPWYVLYAVPGALTCLSLTMCGWSKKTTRIFVSVLVCAALGPWWFAADRRYIGKSKEDLKGLARVIKEKAGAGAFLLGGVFTDVDVYTPRVRTLHDVRELDALITEARSTGKKLLVTYGREGLMKAQMPGLLKRLQDEHEFRPVAVVRGLEEEQFTHRVLVWTTQ